MHVYSVANAWNIAYGLFIYYYIILIEQIDLAIPKYSIWLSWMQGCIVIIPHSMGKYGWICYSTLILCVDFNHSRWTYEQIYCYSTFLWINRWTCCHLGFFEWTYGGFIIILHFSECLVIQELLAWCLNVDPHVSVVM